MSHSIILACLWVVAANVAGLLPSRRNHWPAAWLLIGTGIPILGYVTYQHGPWIAIVIAAAGASILRWPLWYLVRWLRRAALRNQD